MRVRSFATRLSTCISGEWGKRKVLLVVGRDGNRVVQVLERKVTQRAKARSVGLVNNDGLIVGRLTIVQCCPGVATDDVLCDCAQVCVAQEEELSQKGDSVSAWITLRAQSGRASALSDADGVNGNSLAPLLSTPVINLHSLSPLTELHINCLHSSFSSSGSSNFSSPRSLTLHPLIPPRSCACPPGRLAISWSVICLRSHERASCHLSPLAGPPPLPTAQHTSHFAPTPSRLALHALHLIVPSLVAPKRCHCPLYRP